MADDLTARLRATFLQELEEQVVVLNQALLTIEQSPEDAEAVRTLFRAAHTIKGAARVADAPVIERTCHELETLFAQVRDGTRTLTGAEFSLLFAAVDGLTEAGRAMRSGATSASAMLGGLLGRLQALVSGTGSAPAPASPAPPAAPIEMTAAAAERAPPQDDVVRVSSEQLDTLLSAAGELMIVTGRIVERLGRQSDDARVLDIVSDRVSDLVHRLRLRPLADACEALPRAVRDVAAARGREVRFEMQGTDVEVDRIVIDALREPLLHLVRNAVDHGIEQPEERERQGKPRTGTVIVTAELASGRVAVSVTDDGRGLDESAVRSSLRERGIAPPATTAGLIDALFAGGISTRGEVTAISGRGVGLDLVRAALERIGGSADVAWTPGKGTRFTLECPPTPAAVRALMVRVGDTEFALPTSHVERLRRVSAEDLREAEGVTILPSEHGPISVSRLATVLGPPLEARAADGAATLVILAAGARRAGIIVDEALDEDEIVMRPLQVDADAAPYASGAAILPSGRVALVLSAPALVAATAGGRGESRVTPLFAPPAASQRRRVLVADDSITTRTLEQSVLESAGYEVTTAVDGEDAWRKLETVGADAVVADVEMPRMDGFSLTRRIRASERFARLPVVLVTGLSTAEDRARGLDAGADAYVVKSNFDQASLLATLQELIGE